MRSAGPPHVLGLMLLTGLALTVVVPYHPELNNPNEHVRVYMSAAMAEEGSYRIDGMRRRWGWTNDAACVEVQDDGQLTACEGRRSRNERRFYSVKAPGLSFLGALPYALAVDDAAAWGLPRIVWMLRLTCVVFPMLLFLGFFLRFLRREETAPGLAEVVFLAVALGSPFLGYSLLFVSHSPGAAAAFGAFALLVGRRRETAPGGARGLGRAAIAGGLAAGASFMEYPSFFASLALSVMALRVYGVRGAGLRELIAFVAGALVPTGLTMHFQRAAFGSPFLPGHRFVESEFLRHRHEQGFFGAEGFSVETAAELLFDARIGMFALTPLLALGVVGYASRLRVREERLPSAVALFIVVLSYLSVCTLNNYDGGWSIGARYLVLLLPFLGHGALLVLGPLHRRSPLLATALMVGTGLAGLVSAMIPSLVYPHVPPEYDRPLRQLFLMLASEGRWPPTLLEGVGLGGSVAVIGLTLAAAGAVVAMAVRGLRREDRLASVGAGLLLGALLLLPQLVGGRPAGHPDLERIDALVLDTFAETLPGGNGD